MTIMARTAREGYAKIPRLDQSDQSDLSWRMPHDRVYSTYEAKTRFSEVMRLVREGRSVIVTYQGEPVAEIRPLDPKGGTAARLEWLRSRGSVLAGRLDREAFAPLVPREGALRRFLDDRHG